MITENSVIWKSKELLMSIIDNEAVILGINSGKYIGLNEIGTEIWRRLDEPILVSDLIKEFIENYNEEKATIREHILEFLTALDERSLINFMDDSKL